MFLRNSFLCAWCVLLAATSAAWRTIPAKDVKAAYTAHGGFAVTTNENKTYQVCDATNTNTVGSCSPL